MHHPFAPVVAQLDVLRNKLNDNTFKAVFGHTFEERQEAASQAARVADEMERLLTQAWQLTQPVISFLEAPRRPLLASVAEFIRLVEQAPAPASPGGCTDWPRSAGVPA